MKLLENGIDLLSGSHHLCRLWKLAEGTIYGSSNWLIVGLSMERFMMTWFPFKSRWMLRPSRSLKAVLIIVGINLIANSFVIKDTYSQKGKCVSWVDGVIINATKEKDLEQKNFDNIKHNSSSNYDSSSSLNNSSNFNNNSSSRSIDAKSVLHPSILFAYHAKKGFKPFLGKLLPTILVTVFYIFVVSKIRKSRRRSTVKSKTRRKRKLNGELAQNLAAVKDGVSIGRPSIDGSVQMQRPSIDGSVQLQRPSLDGPLQLQRQSSDGHVHLQRQSSDGPVQLQRQSSDGPLQLQRQSSDGPVQLQRPLVEGSVPLQGSTSDASSNEGGISFSVVPPGALARFRVNDTSSIHSSVSNVTHHITTSPGVTCHSLRKISGRNDRTMTAVSHLCIVTAASYVVFGFPGESKQLLTERLAGR